MEAAVPAAPSAAPTETPAASTPSASDQAVASKDFSAFKAARHAERTGTPLEPTKPAESSPAQPAEQVASTDALPKAASEPVKPNADTRKQQLAAEIEADLKRRKELRDEIAREESRLASLKTPAQPETPKAASSPAADASDPEPDPTNAQKYPGGEYDPRFLKDQARWEARSEVRAEQQRLQAAQQRDARTKQVLDLEASSRERMAAVLKDDPQFFTNLSPDIQSLVPTWRLGADDKGSWKNVLADHLFQSDHAAALMRHFTAHPDEFTALGRLHPAQFFQTLGRLEATLTKPATPAALPIKHVTSAPEPPSVVGSRPADAGDPVDAALSSGNFLAFKAARHKARMASNGQR